MIKYTFYQKNPSSHYVYIDLQIDGINSDSIKLQLPSWRPGRYELGNFAKNIKRVDAYNSKNETLAYKKLSKDLWEIETKGNNSIKVTYSYYAAELNAGACYADEQQIYINPVHCCMYIVGREIEKYSVKLDIPHNYKVACSIPLSDNTFVAENYDELADTPFIASSLLKTESYTVEGVKFYLHFNGECQPDFGKVKADFEKFTKYQFDFWQGFPFNEYHFLFQITPNKFYHGVEHLKNTVIALGPGYAINSGKTYEDLLGVSCHELFHSWNIKTIRPKEMLPYDFTKENYAETGYVYEGFTTYYGDKNLLSSGVFTLEQYFETLEERLEKHFNNYGRYNLSVSASSWDTWLDGYTPGAPYRKTNIYDEGSLIAFKLDVMIMLATDNKKSLRDVCRVLYNEFGKKNVGYTSQDILNIINKVSGKDLTEFFKKYVQDANDFEESLNYCFSYLGLELVKEENPNLSERWFGFKTADNGSFAKVSLVAPYSPAWNAGIFNGDDIIAVNEIVVRNNLSQLLNYFEKSNHLNLTLISAEKIKTVKISRDTTGKTWFFKPKLKLKKEVNPHQTENFNVWKQY